MTKVKAFNNPGKGFRPSSGLTVEVDGLQQTAFLLARVTNEELPKNMNAYHARQIGVLTQRARQNFEESVTRPNESGARVHARMSGRFVFGGDSGTFRGKIINEPSTDQYGFGYPDIATADRRTNYVWRTLEFGLAPHPQAIKHPFAPIGRAKFPSKFTFLPFSGGGGVFTPRGAGSGPSGVLVTPRGRVIRRVPHPGIAPRQFITRAFEALTQTVVEGYSTVTAQTYKDFR